MSQKLKGKRGRPFADIPHDKFIKARLSSTELLIIKAKAAKAQISLSDFIRSAVLKGKVEVFKRELPQQAKKGIALLSNLSNNVNQLARRHNLGDILTLQDRLSLIKLKDEIIALKVQMQDYVDFKKENSDGY